MGDGELPLTELDPGRFLARLPRGHYKSMTAPHRPAEVAMVIERAAGWILLQTKVHYPPGVFRIPTGAVQPGEQAEQAMLRELMEESNLIPGSHRVFLRLHYEVDGRRQSFHSDAFLIQRPRGELRPLDPHEGISAWREAPVRELDQVARELRQLAPPRHDWGVFRSALHQCVARVLPDLLQDRA